MTNDEATTMSVLDMGRLLGLKKTESYYLLHKHNFETVQVAGKTRIVKASFEEWYDRQDWYKKVDGPLPGTKLREQLYTVQEIADMLAINKDTALEMIQKVGLLTLNIGGKFRIPKTLFDTWYDSQNWYRNAEDRAHDLTGILSSMTVPDMGRLVGIDRRNAWKLWYSAKDKLELIRIAQKPRITMNSFCDWYVGQSDYHLLPTSEMPNLSPWNEFVTPTEVATRLQANPKTIYRLLKCYDPDSKKMGSAWFVQYYKALYIYLEGGNDHGIHC